MRAISPFTEFKTRNSQQKDKPCKIFAGDGLPQKDAGRLGVEEGGQSRREDSRLGRLAKSFRRQDPLLVF